MKKSTIFKLALLGIILSPFTVSAQTDTQYPAANFQPKVIFTDESVTAVSKSAETSKTVHVAQTDSQYPAANFQPKVIFIDESAAKATSSDHAPAHSSSTGKKTAFDPKYPAASFEPKVIYPDSAS